MTGGASSFCLSDKLDWGEILVEIDEKDVVVRGHECIFLHALSLLYVSILHLRLFRKYFSAIYYNKLLCVH